MRRAAVGGEHPSTPQAVASVVQRVIDEVHATTPVRLSWRPGFGYMSDGLGGVVHLADQRPAPDWVEPPGQRTAHVHWPALGSDAAESHELDTAEALTTEVTGTVADVVQLELFRRGLEPTWPACPAHPGGHPLKVGDGGLWTCRRGGAVVPLGRLGYDAPLVRRRPLPGPGPDVLTELVALVLDDVHETTEVELVLRLDGGAGDETRSGTLHLAGHESADRPVDAEPAPDRRSARVSAPRVSSVSEWIWELPPEQRPYQIPEGAEPFDLEQTVGTSLHHVAVAALTIVRQRLLETGGDPNWPACPRHRGEHALELSDTMSDTDDTVLWWCPAGAAVAFVGELSAAG